jgi:hypothetical protein
MSDLRSVDTVVGIRRERAIEQESDDLGAGEPCAARPSIQLTKRSVREADRDTIADGGPTDTRHTMSIRRRKSSGY